MKHEQSTFKKTQNTVEVPPPSAYSVVAVNTDTIALSAGAGSPVQVRVGSERRNHSQRRRKVIQKQRRSMKLRPPNQRKAQRHLSMCLMAQGDRHEASELPRELPPSMLRDQPSSPLPLPRRYSIGTASISGCSSHLHSLATDKGGWSPCRLPKTTSAIDTVTRHDRYGHPRRCHIKLGGPRAYKATPILLTAGQISMKVK